ncbi:hypothetical protein, partial [Hyalangium minutum]
TATASSLPRYSRASRPLRLLWLLEPVNSYVELYGPHLIQHDRDLDLEQSNPEHFRWHVDLDQLYLSHDAAHLELDSPHRDRFPADVARVALFQFRLGSRLLF